MAPNDDDPIPQRLAALQAELRSARIERLTAELRRHLPDGPAGLYASHMADAMRPCRDGGGGYELAMPDGSALPLAEGVRAWAAGEGASIVSAFRNGTEAAPRTPRAPAPSVPSSVSPRMAGVLGAMARDMGIDGSDDGSR